MSWSYDEIRHCTDIDALDNYLNPYDSSDYQDGPLTFDVEIENMHGDQVGCYLGYATLATKIKWKAWSTPINHHWYEPMQYVKYYATTEEVVDAVGIPF